MIHFSGGVSLVHASLYCDDLSGLMDIKLISESVGLGALRDGAPRGCGCLFARRRHPSGCPRTMFPTQAAGLKLIGMNPSQKQRAPRPLNVFLSYSHDNADHKAWVLRLATDLRQNGVDSHIDQWDCGPGADITQYMEKAIRKADRVLLITTPAYARKANAAKGGVGYERLVVTSQLAEQLDKARFTQLEKNPPSGR
jgi:TIR domain-containing protein